MLTSYAKRKVYTKNTKHYFYATASCSNKIYFAYVSERNKQTENTQLNKASIVLLSDRGGQVNATSPRLLYKRKLDTCN